MASVTVDDVRDVINVGSAKARPLEVNENQQKTTISKASQCSEVMANAQAAATELTFNSSSMYKPIDVIK